MKKILVKALVAAGLVSSAVGTAFGCDGGGEGFIGSVCFTAASFCPQDYMAANGAQMSINQYAVLYSLLGATYGGDRRTYFNLPDLQGRSPVGTGIADALNGTPVTLGQKRGQESVVLTTSQIAQHNHSATFTPQIKSQAVTIPASPATGSLSASGSVTLVSGAPDASATNTPSSGSYNLTGVSVNSGPTAYTTKGPYTTKSVGANPPAVNVKVAVTPSPDYVPPTSMQQISVNGVTGGTVTVGENTPTGSPVATIPPQLGLTACILVDGLYPSRN